MEREVSFEEISDGKRYGLNDMVRADCGDCRGCSACCHGMGSSILLDPLDVFRMTQALDCSFQQLLTDQVELNLVDGLILPNLRMSGEAEACGFLNEAGRCSIHPARPGICRLFPLGRIYEDGDFRYFLQVHECRNENRSKIKLKKWIAEPHVQENAVFIREWHYFLKACGGQMQAEGLNAQQVKALGMYLLKQFYMEPYAVQETEGEAELSFYQVFHRRLEAVRNRLGV